MHTLEFINSSIFGPYFRLLVPLSQQARESLPFSASFQDEKTVLEYIKSRAGDVSVLMEIILRLALLALAIWQLLLVFSGAKSGSCFS